MIDNMFENIQSNIHYDVYSIIFFWRQENAHFRDIIQRDREVEHYGSSHVKILPKGKDLFTNY